MEAKKLSVLIAGCGRVSEKHAKAIKTLSDRYKLIGACDVNENAARAMIANCGKAGADAKVYNDWKKAIDELSPDVVAITLPSGMHYEVATYAMEKGSNLLLEKPMAMSEAEAHAIYDISKKTKKTIAMGHIYRYLPVVKILRDDIAKGVFGKVTHGSIYVRWGHGDDYYDSAAWRGTWKADGGALMNQTIHAIDLLVWLMGTEPIEAQAMIAQRLRHIEAEDLGYAILRMEDGSLAHIEGTTATSPAEHSAEFSVFCENGQITMGLVSGKPHINIRDGAGKKLNFRYLRKQNKEGGLSSFKTALNPHLGIYKDLHDSIINDKEPIASAYDGYSSVDTLMGIYKAALTGKAVELPLKESFSSLDMKDYFKDL